MSRALQNFGPASEWAISVFIQFAVQIGYRFLCRVTRAVCRTRWTDAKHFFF